MTATKAFTLAIIAMLSVSITMNTVLLYSIGLSLRNQEVSLSNQEVSLSNQEQILENQYEVLEEQDRILLGFINRTDVTLDQVGK